MALVGSACRSRCSSCDLEFARRSGIWQQIRLLAFPLGDNDEQGRAAFAPPSGRLSSEYVGAAFELAAFAREQAGQLPVAKWAETAGDSAARQQAFIRYLVGADDRTVALLASAAKWLPNVDELANSPLLAGLRQDEKNRLLAKLGYSSHGNLTLRRRSQGSRSGGATIMGICGLPMI
jgi:hypothetical protein